MVRSLSLSAAVVPLLLLLLVLSGGGGGSLLRTADAFGLHRSPSSTIASGRSSTALFGAMNKRNKFNKQKDLAAKMAEAKRRRESSSGDGGSDEDVNSDATTSAKDGGGSKENLSAAEIKLRNDKQRFADMLENSLSGGGGGGDFEKGYYLTEQQENENADAVFRGVVRLYEGDPAPTAPFEGLLDVETGEPYGKGGAKRLVPWEGSRSASSSNHLVVVTDPRPKSSQLRTAIKLLAGSMGPSAGNCLVINPDTPAENRRFLKRNFGKKEDGGGAAAAAPRIACDEKLDWMREYTALGEKRYSITVFVLREGRVEKIAREVEAEVLPMVVKNAIRSLA